jgi:hypothetical protein
MKNTHHAIVGTALFVLIHIVGLQQAHANCAIFGYDMEVDSETNTVTIDADADSCSGAGAMLRENVDTGEVVELQGCTEESYDVRFVDECLPVGTYRYGLADPLRCGCGSRELFIEVTIEDELDVNCDISDPDLMALPYTEELPWGDESWENCVTGCSVTSSQADIVFPTYGLIALIGLSLVARRWLTGR